MQMGKAYKALRCLQIYIRMLHNVNENLVFSYELLSIGACIFSGFASLAHFAKHPVYGMMYFVIFSEMILISSMIYGKGFKIPVLFQNAQASIRLHLNYLGKKVQRKLLPRKVMSIPPVGIKVGDLQSLERTSTSVFLQYVLSNIVSMLVANE